MESEEGGALIPQEPFRIVEKYLMHLKVALVEISYYEWTSLTLTVGDIAWNSCINNLSLQWKAIQDLKKNDDSTLPKLSMTVSMVKKLETHESHAYQAMGHQ